MGGALSALLNSRLPTRRCCDGHLSNLRRAGYEYVTRLQPRGSHRFVTVTPRDCLCGQLSCARANGYSSHQLFDDFLCHPCDKGAGGSGLQTVCVCDPSDPLLWQRTSPWNVVCARSGPQRHQPSILTMKSKRDHLNVFLKLIAHRERRHMDFSCGAAVEFSPRRKPWVDRKTTQVPAGAKELGSVASISVAPTGAYSSASLSHGSRRGLPSVAPPVLGVENDFENSP